MIRINSPIPDLPFVPDPSTARGFGNLEEYLCEEDQYGRLVHDLRNSGLLTTNCNCLTVAKNSFKGRALVDWLVLEQGTGKEQF